MLTAVAGNVLLEAAAFDGPLRKGLDVIGRYRTAERMLTRRLGAKIGKPGQASAPIGKALNAAANTCARIIRERCHLAPALHAVAIDKRAIVEAFPTAFMGLLLSDPSSIATRRGDRSDLFYQHLAASGQLSGLIDYLLPGRISELDLASLMNHDDRAALVCAITALCVTTGDFTAVGDTDGWIVLPPREVICDWALYDLEANARDEAPGCLHVGWRLQRTQSRNRWDT